MDTKEIQEKLGGYNEFPPNFEEITQSHFLWLWNVKPANRTYVYRQVYTTEPDGSYDYKKNGPLSFWVFPDFSGIGWQAFYNGRATRVEEDAYTCRYFKFKWCDHEFRTENARMCYREYVCNKCGYREVVDSSG